MATMRVTTNGEGAGPMRAWHGKVRARGVVDVVDVVDVSSHTLARFAQATLPERVGELLAAGSCLIVLNITEVPVLESRLLGDLVACRDLVRRRGGLLKLVTTRSQVELLSAGELDHLFESYRDEDAALDSFEPEDATAGIP
jgi:anti-anti-sigma regulatory factor